MRLRRPRWLAYAAGGLEPCTRTRRSSSRAQYSRLHPLPSLLSRRSSGINSNDAYLWVQMRPGGGLWDIPGA